jgi:uncharacterized protein (TIGR00159 family)
LVFALYLTAQVLQLYTVLNIMSALLFNALLIIVVVFQHDIRRGLMRVGSGAWFGTSRSQESRVIDEVVEAATELARHRTGAIITFEQDANLDEFVGVHKGYSIDAEVSRSLLVSLFVPEAMNKLHDGAVIIRDLRIAKAGVFFPMPESSVTDASFGSRHRAALGITEETDAVIVVVSEERGTISFFFNGNIVTNLDGPGLRSALDGVFSPKITKPKAGKKRRKSKRTGRSTVPTLTPIPGQVAVESSEPPERLSVHIITTTGENDLVSETPAAPLRRTKAEADRARESQMPPLRKFVETPPPPLSRVSRPPPSVEPLSRTPAMPKTEPMRRSGEWAAVNSSDEPTPDSKNNGEPT